MRWPLALMLLYGIFSIVMGLLGTMMSPNHEIMSLAGGGGVGILIIGCAALVKTHPRAGYIIATVLALLEAGMMGKAALAGTSVLKSIIFFVSLLFALALVAAHYLGMSSRKKEQSVEPTA